MEGQQTIGIIGGGQLGRMLTLAAHSLGFKVVVVDPAAQCPAAQVGAEQITADLYDKAALKKLAERADFITVEIEHLDTRSLQEISKLGVPVNPAPQTIGLIQDKLSQKEFLHKASVPVAPFAPLTDKASAEQLFKVFGGKMLIKARHGAYDGRGNMLIKTLADIDTALEKFKGRELYAEQYIPFTKELAVMVARSADRKIAVYPVVETKHERNICLEVQAPAAITSELANKASHIALRVAHLLEGAGTYGIEMFLTDDAQILVNEIAPRVHNSGHYTIEATRTSQFEQHIRAVTGLPLGSTELVTPAAVMINILGERNGPTRLEGLADTLAVPQTSVHIYGKSPTQIDRKMGHITVTGDNLPAVLKRARRARKMLKI